MNQVRFRWSLLTVFAFIGGFLYTVLTLISWGFFPGPFNPLNNYLSQLGNSSLNPAGAIFYNMAIFSAGLSLIPMFLGIYKFYSREKASRLLILILFLGILNGISIIMSGIFSEDFYEQHVVWSLMIFVTMIPLLFTTNIGLWNYQDFSKPISIYGILSGLFDTIFVIYVVLFGTSTGAILEWITVFAYMSWTILVASRILWREKQRNV